MRMRRRMVGRREAVVWRGLLELLGYRKCIRVRCAFGLKRMSTRTDSWRSETMVRAVRMPDEGKDQYPTTDF